MKSFLGKLIKRIEKTVISLFKLSVLTWIVVFIAVCKGWIAVNSFLEFGIFTASLIGIKTWQSTKEKMNGM